MNILCLPQIHPLINFICDGCGIPSRGLICTERIMCILYALASNDAKCINQVTTHICRRYPPLKDVLCISHGKENVSLNISKYAKSTRECCLVVGDSTHVGTTNQYELWYKFGICLRCINAWYDIVLILTVPTSIAQGLAATTTHYHSTI